MYFDTHCHLDFPIFDAQLDQWLKKLQMKQVSHICVPSIGPSNWQRVLQLGKLYPDQVYCALGIHPCFLPAQNDSIERLTNLVQTHRHAISAIGEIGLDGRYSNDDQQEHIFGEQLLLAKRVELPVLVHCVKRHHRLLPMLKQAALNQAGVIHAFTGDYKTASTYIDMGFKLGVGASFMWPSASPLREALTKLPLQAIVFETDAPDMPLPGHKKGDATPLDVIEVAKHFAALRQESTKTVIDAVYKSSCMVIRRNA